MKLHFNSIPALLLLLLALVLVPERYSVASAAKARGMTAASITNEGEAMNHAAGGGQHVVAMTDNTIAKNKVRAARDHDERRLWFFRSITSFFQPATTSAAVPTSAPTSAPDGN